MTAIPDGSQQGEVFSRAVACKLPLLDGEHEHTARPTIVEVNPKCLKKLQQMFEEDEKRLKGMICAAWGLLLRCFTGQDAVCFYLEQSNGACLSQPLSDSENTRSIVRLSFLENEKLLDQIAKAQDAITNLEQRQQSHCNTPSKKSSVPACCEANTMIWFQEAGKSWPGPSSDVKNVKNHAIFEVCALRLEALAGQSSEVCEMTGSNS